MYTPAESECVREDATMDAAIHRLIMRRHNSLLVTAKGDGAEIVGVLRLTDVFDTVNTVMEKH
jgi:CBS domain-containing protein